MFRYCAGLASEIRYYIVNGDPNEDFHLDQLTGQLSVSRGLDYERQRSYLLTVQVGSHCLVTSYWASHIGTNGVGRNL